MTNSKTFYRNQNIPTNQNIPAIDQTVMIWKRTRKSFSVRIESFSYVYHLESKRVENSVFSQEISGENGIFSKKRLSGDFGIYSNSTVQVEKMVKNHGGENAFMVISRKKIGITVL